MLISFCVPSYKNSLAASKIVSDILSCDDERLEVVLCDDASPDDTQKIPLGINDKRFRYVRNSENLGTHKNWLKSLELGRGDWLYLVMGRDKIHGENITGLIEFLSNADKKNITCVRDKYDIKKTSQVFPGINAMIKFLGCNHPTGLIFRRENFMKITSREKYFSSSDMYPENFIARDLLLMGNGAFARSGVFRDEIVIDFAETKSQVESKENIFDAYYSPARRTEQFYELIRMIDECEKFSCYEKNKFFREKFSELLLAVTKAWKALCEDENWQAHYSQQTRKVSKKEMCENIFQAIRDTRGFLRKNNAYTFSREIIMRYLALKRLRRVMFSY